MVDVGAQEKLLLGVLAACEEALSVADLRALLDRAGVLSPVALGLELMRKQSRGDVNCPPDERAAAFRELVQSELFEPVARGIIRFLPAATYTREDPRRRERDFKLAAWLDDPELTLNASGALRPSQMLAVISVLEPLGEEWFASRHPEVQKVLLRLGRFCSLAFFRPLGSWAGQLEEHVEHLLLSGRLAEVEKLAEPGEGLGWLAFQRGEWEASARHFEAALKAGRALHGNRWVFPGLASLVYVLACLGCGRRTQAARYLKLSEGGAYPFPWLAPLFDEAPDRQHLAKVRQTMERPLGSGGVAALPFSLMLTWRFAELAEVHLPWLKENVEGARRAGYAWLADQLDAVVRQLRGEELPAGVWLVNLLLTEAPWQQHLSALRKWCQEGAGESESARLVWEVGPGGMAAREQKRRGDSWGAGKLVTTTRLLQDPPACLSAQDRRMLTHLHAPDNRIPQFDPRAWLELVGHPLVFYKDEPVQVVMDQPRLQVYAQGGGVRLELEPPTYRPIDVDFSQPGQVRVLDMPATLRQLYSLVGSGLPFPAQAQEELLGLLGELEGRVAVESFLEQGEERGADSEPCVLLSPLGEGLQIQVRVRPAGPQGPALRAGQGALECLAQVGGHLSRVRRDHAAELEGCEALLASCPTLREATEWNWDFTVGELEASLTVLEELQACGVRLEWPQGKAWKLRPALGVASLNLSLRQEREWFAVRGEVRLDERRVLELRELLERLDAHGGRFVALEDGEFLALTRDLRRRLDELNRVTEGAGKKLLLHPLAGAPLEALGEAGATVEADEAWSLHLRRLQEARSLVPVVPVGLQAELRPYQEAGFQWLARLAHAGAGACLADDMGLGKTVQTLALLLSQASEGPALVVCPTSVGYNWLEEARRFTPSLRVAFLGRDREAQVAGLGAGDVLVVSYGLLHTCSTLLAGREWQVIVLDEAHNVKNARSKRAQAALALQGRVRVALTGTPVENHLGELWSLFRFLNPGLLGSEKSFGERFVRPIEGKDRAAALTLRSLLAPFTLRRMKSQVLEELPPRTEIVRRVELMPEERALYEAARKRASEGLEEGAGLFHVLAELTRLRRLCCHPRLVMPESTLAGSKLVSFLELVDELRENRHRALVFSQFVDHLALVREALEARGVSFLYLDGSTPAVERGPLVAQFQAGKGELFLISLKAGGTGLNLTGADYVIHLDPWWNPAVEDQATDRAHRLGQLRPVTVYRLVTGDTIEEQILELHAHKRDLAEQLLTGQDGESRLDPATLLELLRGGAVAADSEPEVDGLEERALRVVGEVGQISVSTAGEALGMPRPAAKALLERMAARGALRKVGERGPGVHYVAR